MCDAGQGLSVTDYTVPYTGKFWHLKRRESLVASIIYSYSVVVPWY